MASLKNKNNKITQSQITEILLYKDALEWCKKHEAIISYHVELNGQKDAMDVVDGREDADVNSGEYYPIKIIIKDFPTAFVGTDFLRTTLTAIEYMRKLN